MLALGVYVLLFGFNGDECLFPGSDQYERFRKKMKKVLIDQELPCEDFGTHSFRKGAATYAAGGSTSCPSISAICLRAGWTIGAVQDRYIRYESAADMFVGRTVSGLPPDDPRYQTLPPHFTADIRYKLLI